MTDLQLELTRRIGEKEYILCSQWIEIYRIKDKEEAKKIMNDWNDKWRDYCEKCADIFEKPADNEIDINEEITPTTLSNFHRWMNRNEIEWGQWWAGGIRVKREKTDRFSKIRLLSITYDASKDLLDQNEETLKQIISFITKYSLN